MSCGIIPIYRDTNTNILKVLLVQGHGNFWGFPKGGKEGNETHQETAIRELKEETQLVCAEVLSHLLYTERYRIEKKKGSDIIKKVLYYVGLVETPHVKRQRGEIKKAVWFEIEQSFGMLTPDRKIILQKAIDQLKSSGHQY